MSVDTGADISNGLNQLSNFAFGFISFFQTHPTILALTLGTLLFILALLISQLISDDDFKLIIAILIGIIVCFVAPIMTTDTTAQNVIFALATEIWGSIFVVGLWLILKNLGFDWHSSYIDMRIVLSCFAYMIFILLFSLVLMYFVDIEFAESSYLLSKHINTIALILGVEILAGAISNTIVLLFLVIYICIRLAETHSWKNLTITIVGLIAFLMLGLQIFRVLPVSIYEPSFPRNLGLACMGAFMSMSIYQLWNRFDRSESAGQFWLSRIAVVVIAILFMLTSTQDDNIFLSLSSELFGVLFIATLTENHIFSKKRRTN